MIIKILLAAAFLITGCYLLLTTFLLESPQPLTTSTSQETEQLATPPEFENQEFGESTEIISPEAKNAQDQSAVDQIQTLEQCRDAFTVAAQAFSELNYEKLSPCLTDPAVFILSESSHMPTLNKNDFIEELKSFVPNATSWTTNQEDPTITGFRNTNPEIANSIIFIADDETTVMLDVNVEGKIDRLRLLESYTYWFMP